MTHETDREWQLIQQIKHGNIAAMKDFYTLFSGYLTAVCARYLSDKEDIKDVLQESFINIYKSAGKFEYRGAGSLKAWSARIAANEALKHLKEREKLKITNVPDWDLPDVADADEPDFGDIPTSVIMQMIQSLPTGYRTVFNLYVFEQKSHKEIAAMLHIAENSSASQFHRAKSLLMKEINKYRSKN